MSKYSKHINPSNIPQSEKADPKQVANNAGGFSFAVDKWTRLERFLILGSEGGSYYATERALTIENANCVKECLKENGLRTVAAIVDISTKGRAPKNEPAVFALALAAAAEDNETRKYALSSINAVCRTGTHLFQFTEAVNSLRGWGRGLKNAVGNWYESKTPASLEYQVLKYQQRNGWSHRDVLRLAHVDPTSDKNAIYRWACKGLEGMDAYTVVRKDESVENRPALELTPLLAAYERLKKTTDVNQAVNIIREYKLTHEMTPGELKSKPEVWEALSHHMPMNALIRNLGKLTSVGVLKPLSNDTKRLVEQLSNANYIKSARVHPLNILVALNTYKQGHGDKGSLTWNPVKQVLDALDDAFYKSFEFVEPTGKNFLLALDVSGSMTAPIAGMNLNCRDASAALAMVTARTESSYHIVGFSTASSRSYGGMWGGESKLVDIDITAKDSLSTVIRKMQAVPMGGTDCALPFVYAKDNKLDVDTFCVYTDSETWHGKVHPHVALKNYRKAVNPKAKSVVVGMTADEFTIADPNDAGSLDVVGFSTDTPSVISSFSKDM